MIYNFFEDLYCITVRWSLLSPSVYVSHEIVDDLRNASLILIRKSYNFNFVSSKHVCITRDTTMSARKRCTRVQIFTAREESQAWFSRWFNNANPWTYVIREFIVDDDAKMIDCQLARSITLRGIKRFHVHQWIKNQFWV